MVFSSPIFLYLFLPLTMAGYFLTHRMGSLRVTHAYLFLVSSLFYFWGEQERILVLYAVCLCDFFGALLVQRFRDANKRDQAKLTIGLLVGFNLCLLSIFKYFSFFRENLNTLFPGLVHSLPKNGFFDFATMPLGISFFTFQSISYSVDVYRGKVRAKTNLLDYACFITLFPQLIAGPIVRYAEIQGSLLRRPVIWAQMASGVHRFVMGLGKKMIIANTAAVVADRIFSFSPQNMDWFAVWVGALAYTCQIYFDFSGYSDMAIGLGHMLGFTFPENFNYPYVSKSIQDFWRKWHMSLSAWFRDYLYIPLGGNRTSRVRSYLNLIIVFLLCGLWHGASWTFVVWGAYHGTFLILERTRFGALLGRLPAAIAHIYVLLVVVVGWVVFRSPDIDYARQFIVRMFDWTATGYVHGKDYCDVYALTIFACGVIGSTPLLARIGSRLQLFTGGAYIQGFFALLVFILSQMALLTQSYNPFIYFRF